jgi:hypothetical protein
MKVEYVMRPIDSVMNKGRRQGLLRQWHLHGMTHSHSRRVLITGTSQQAVRLEKSDAQE